MTKKVLFGPFFFVPFVHFVFSLDFARDGEPVEPFHA